MHDVPPCWPWKNILCVTEAHCGWNFSLTPVISASVFYSRHLYQIHSELQTVSQSFIRVGGRMISFIFKLDISLNRWLTFFAGPNCSVAAVTHPTSHIFIFQKLGGGGRIFYKNTWKRRYHLLGQNILLRIINPIISTSHVVFWYKFSVRSPLPASTRGCW